MEDFIKTITGEQHQNCIRNYIKGTLADTRSQTIVREIVEGFRACDALVVSKMKPTDPDLKEWNGFLTQWDAILAKGNSFTYSR